MSFYTTEHTNETLLAFLVLYKTRTGLGKKELKATSFVRCVVFRGEHIVS
jgi:hypothetical protein